MRCLEHGVTGRVVDVAAGRDADTAHLRSQRVGQVVAIEIHGCDDIEFLRPRQNLLQRNVRNSILDQDFAGGECSFLFRICRFLAFVDHRAIVLIPGVGLVGEFALGKLVAPVAEGAFRELHDVALVHEGQALAAVRDAVLECRADQAFGAFLRYRFQADAAASGEADLLVFGREILLEELEEFRIRIRAALELDARVNVLGVFAEDHHVDIFRVAHGRRHAGEPAYRAQADVEIEQLAQRHVEGTDAAADRRRQRALDGHEVLAAGGDRLVRQPAAGQVE